MQEVSGKLRAYLKGIDMRSILIGLLFFVFILEAGAQSTEKTIPFANTIVMYSKTVDEGRNSPSITMQSQSPISTINIETVVNQVPAAQISSLIKDVKEVVCNGLQGKANIRVWLSFDAEAKIVVLSASAQGGIEVTFNCG